MIAVRFGTKARVAALALIVALGSSGAVHAQVTAFRQAVAETAAQDDDLAAFYRARNFEGIWTGSDQAAQDRRNAFLGALSMAGVHGLPTDRFDPNALMAKMQAATTAYEKGAVEAEMSELFLAYARGVQTGILTPGAILRDNHREVPLRDKLQLLSDLTTSEPAAFFDSLPPQTAEYARLVRAKIGLEQTIAAGGWGATVPAGKLEPGSQGQAVIALRNRLVAMGYLDRNVSATYDAGIKAAVERFQAYHGLTVDGVAGGSTIEAINVQAEDRLKSVIVAMERERWLGQERGDRHIWVNLTDFTAKIIDNDIVTFETRSVIGANSDDRRSPEFSDMMEFMVINPSWYVPRSIIVNEYLPALRSNPGAAGHLEIVNSRGQVINRGSANFASFSAASFPYSMRQPPGPRNALGSVKFMFPNQYNIYLHDTPAQDLFAREVRAFSHGCIRLDDPHDFAYALLALQSDDPEGLFQSHLKTGKESRVNLDQPVPVHLDYRTAFTNVDGTLQFRNDIYGRDAVIWQALEREGVAVGGVQG